MEYSQSILLYMESQGVTGYRLAKETGISESLFGKWRNKPTSKIDASNLTKIAKYFNISVDELVNYGQNKTPLTDKDKERINTRKYITDELMKMSDEELQVFFKMFFGKK